MVAADGQLDVQSYWTLHPPSVGSLSDWAVQPIVLLRLVKHRGGGDTHMWFQNVPVLPTWDFSFFDVF